ncbi:MAG: SDR family oxidoreductase [Proteobacteria bacterium]|nr:SDR family oxidoreductase [Pseudomonadota bacterium]
MEIRLDGRRALITGASRGLGLAMARRFAASGADVAIAARRPDVLEAARAEIARVSNGRVFAYPCDVADAAQVGGLFEAAERDLGQIDILVNNAGTSKRGPFETITDQVWMDDFNLKLFAAIRLCRLAFPGMKARRWGRILNILNSGAKAPPAEGAPTAVTRAAGMALTKVLAGEGAAHNVLVNALLTGIFVTEQWQRRWQRDPKGLSFEDFVTAQGKTVPIGRMGDPEEYANIACFLASDAASYITGTAVNVDGGRCPVV